MTEEKKREYSLDVLKIIGTLIIVVYHFQGNFDVHYGPVDFAGGKFYFGYIVELFFMLSGYFAESYKSRIENGMTFDEYFSARFLRLIPVIFVCTVLYTGLFTYLWRGNNIKLWSALVTALGIQTGGAFNEIYVNSQLWYVSVLLICYAVFFLVTRIGTSRNIDRRYLYVLVILAGVSCATYGINLPFLNPNVGRGYIAFFIGVLLAGALRNRTVTGKLAIPCAGLSVIMLFLILFAYKTVEYDIVYFLDFVLYPAIIIVFRSEFCRRIFNWKFLGTLAGISFNTYVWHLDFNTLSSEFLHLMNITVDYSKFTTEIIYVLLEFGIGALSYFYLEKPLSKLTKKWVAVLHEKCQAEKEAQL